MTNNTRIALAAVLIAAFATPALAHDEWIVDSGRLHQRRHALLRNAGIILGGASSL